MIGKNERSFMSFCAVWSRVRRAYVAFACAALLAASTAVAAVPGQFHYQGRLTVADQPLNGSATLVFRFFTAAEDGDLLYEETQALTVVDGFYATQIGATTPIPAAVFRDHESVYLEIDVDGRIMSPRERIVAVGYALSAQYAQEAQVAHRLVGQQPAAAVIEQPETRHVGSTTNIAFYVHMNDVEQTITDAVETKIDWQGAEYDTSPAVNLGTDRFVAPVAGYYRLTAQLYLTPDVLRTLSKHDQKLVKIQLRRNGSTISSFVHRTSGKGGFSVRTSREIFLSATDYVDVYLQHNLSPDLDLIVSGPSYLSWFSGYLIHQ